ncbi:MAG: hypothetical protein ACI4A5_00355 [Hominilimicola sp.]
MVGISGCGKSTLFSKIRV